jgi:hypothetical protein
MRPFDPSRYPDDPLRLHARGMAAVSVLVDVLRRFPARRSLAPGPLPLGTASRILERAVAATPLEREPQGNGLGSEAVDVYVALASGVYQFDRVCRLLYSVSPRDIRPELSSLDRLPPAPLNLIYVAHSGRSAHLREQDTTALSAINTATLCEHVDRFCMTEKLVTAARGWLDRAALASSIGLAPGQHLLLVQSIGYPATP